MTPTPKKLLDTTLKTLSLVLSSTLFMPVVLAAPTAPAFPGAQGFGASATGGRGGSVYHVTSLSDSKTKGTLRYGLEEEAKKGPLTIVFDISGNIKLKNRLGVKYNNLTIAGQTAPKGGITVSGYPFLIQGKKGGAVRKNVIIRELRFRTGDFNVRPIADKPAKGRGDLGGDGADGITVTYAENIILDHVSLSWAIDETFDVTHSKSVTLQNSMIYEGLFDSYHSKKKSNQKQTEPHSRTVFLRGYNTPSEVQNKTKGYSIIGNLLAHSNMRMPVVGGEQDYKSGENGTKWLNLEFANNVIYNWGERSGHTATNARIQMNYINNYLIAGKSTKQGTPNESVNPRTAFRVEKSGSDDKNKFFLYQNGNFMDSNRDGVINGKVLSKSGKNWEGFIDFEENEKQSSRFGFPISDSVLLSAPNAYSKVINSVGASLYRDKTDLRIINDMKVGKGVLIDSQDEVGGLEKITEVKRPNNFDTDQDGMPNLWENEHGLDPNSASDRNDKTLSSEGYTNIEVYLSDLVSNKTAKPEEDNVKPSTPKNLTVSNIKQTRFTVKWDAATDNIGVAEYQVHYNDKVKSVTGTSTIITELTPNMNYSVRVKAKDAAGNVSAFSNPQTVVTDAEVSTPTPVFTIKYLSGAGGTIIGDTEQAIKKGGATTTVTARSDSGYDFIKWSDGSTAVKRNDNNITKHQVITALFKKEPITINNDKIEKISASSTISLGQKVNISISYSASKATKLVVKFSKGYSETIDRKTFDIKAGKGKANYTFTVPTNISAGNGYGYMAYISPTGHSPEKTTDYIKKDVTVLANDVLVVEAPVATPLIGPKGNTTDTTPTYSWKAVSGATWYYLWSRDNQGDISNKWYHKSKLGCENGSGTCSVTPETELPLGSVRWYVISWNKSGLSPWSKGMRFTVTDPTNPTAIVPGSPENLSEKAPTMPGAPEEATTDSLATSDDKASGGSFGFLLLPLALMGLRRRMTATKK